MYAWAEGEAPADGETTPVVDVILLVRGGGSMEGLVGLHDEQLARTIVQSPLPLVGGVGHETDFTIADFCADLRAHPHGRRRTGGPAARGVAGRPDFAGRPAGSAVQPDRPAPPAAGPGCAAAGRPSGLAAREQLRLAPLRAAPAALECY